MPIFMFAIGAYIYGLPENVREQIGLTAEGQSVLFNLDIWGWSISPQTSTGMITIFVLRRGAYGGGMLLLAVRVSGDNAKPGAQVFHREVLHALLDQGVPATVGDQL